MSEETFDIPAAPGGIPPEVQKRWRDAYSAAFINSRNKYKRAVGVAAEHSGHTSKDPMEWSRDGLYAAAEVVSTPKITSYEQAIEMEDWHFMLRSPSADGKTLRIVTRDGDKYILPIPY
ncbi:MAG: hypothetical protein ACJ71W_16620 [Terriglobales bacterium]